MVFGSMFTIEPVSFNYTKAVVLSLKLIILSTCYMPSAMLILNTELTKKAMWDLFEQRNLGYCLTVQINPIKLSSTSTTVQTNSILCSNQPQVWGLQVRTVTNLTLTCFSNFNLFSICE